MRNKLTDLNDHLFAELERLSDDEELTDADNFDKEIKRAKAITDVGQAIVNNAKLMFDVGKFAQEYGVSSSDVLQISGGIKREK